MRRADKLVIVGGGGHARVVIELIRAAGSFEIQGILDPRFEIGTEVYGLPLLGSDDILPELYSRGVRSAAIAVGSIKDNHLRKRLFEKVTEIGFFVPPLTHPKASVSPSATFAPGAQVMAGVVVQAGTTVQENVILNTGSIVDHDCVIGKHVHICPGATLSGGCIVGEGAFVGAGATIIQQIRIGREAVVGAGSVVIRDVGDGQRVTGIPAG